jgi:hypothetical protein
VGGLAGLYNRLAELHQRKRRQHMRWQRFLVSSPVTERDMRRKGGCGRLLLAVVVVGLFVLGMGALRERIDRARFPWGYTDSGQPALAGTWVGPIVTGSGQRLGMLLDMKLTPLDRGGRRRRRALIRTRRSSWLEGRSLVCAKPGRIQRFTVHGEPEDTKRASRFRLAFRVADSLPPDGLSPSHILGQWGGKDTITLAVSLYMRQGKSAITSSADPDTGGDTPATLARGTEAEFTALCNRLR